MKAVGLKQVVLSVLFTSIVTAAAGLALAFDLSEYFPLQEANTWTYSVIEDNGNYFETIKVNGTERIGNIVTVKMLFQSEDFYKCMTFDYEGVKEHKYKEGDKYTISVPGRIILPNLELGESKGYSIDITTYDAGDEKITSSSEVGEIVLLSNTDEVEVPAGRFKNCLEYASFSKEEESNSYKTSDCHIWLSSGVGIVKQACFNKRYDIETGTEESSNETRELISAAVDGIRIGN